MKLSYGYVMVVLWLRYSCCGSQERGYVIAAVPARREAVLWLPCQPGENKGVCSSYAPRISFHLLAHTLPTMGSANSVHSEIH